MAMSDPMRDGATTIEAVCYPVLPEPRFDVRRVQGEPDDVYYFLNAKGEYERRVCEARPLEPVLGSISSFLHAIESEYAAGNKVEGVYVYDEGATAVVMECVNGFWRRKRLHFEVEWTEEAERLKKLHIGNRYAPRDAARHLKFSFPETLGIGPLLTILDRETIGQADELLWREMISVPALVYTGIPGVEVNVEYLRIHLAVWYDRAANQVFFQVNDDHLRAKRALLIGKLADTIKEAMCRAAMAQVAVYVAKKYV